MVDLTKYRKAVVAVVGAIAIILPAVGVTVGPDVDEAVVRLYDAVVALLTAVGVYQVSNGA